MSYHAAGTGWYPRPNPSAYPWEIVGADAPDLDWLDPAALAKLPWPGFGRAVNRRWAKHIAQHWDARDDRDVIHVSERADGTLAVIDGRHRVAAAVLAERIAVPAAIYTGLTLQHEARLCLQLNKPRTRSRS
jgi:hypothetical protein